MQIEVHIRIVHNAAQGELAHTSNTPLTTSLKLNGPPATGGPELVTIARSTGTPHEPADETNTHSPDATGPRCTAHRGQRTKASARGAGRSLPQAPTTEPERHPRQRAVADSGRRKRGEGGDAREAAAPPTRTSAQARRAERDRPHRLREEGARRAQGGGGRAQKGPSRISMQFFFFFLCYFYFVFSKNVQVRH